MFRRKMEETLIAWKADKDHVPLVVSGCRQCGKTTLVKDFAKKNYKNVVYIDFFASDKYIYAFEESLYPDDIISLLTAVDSSFKFVPHETVIIFDEIQECPRARTSLKFFSQDKRYDVICTGSLLGVYGYKEQEGGSAHSNAIPVGHEEVKVMYPMDFEEFLWANDESEELIKILEERLSEKKPVPELIHDKMRKLFLSYAVVGGMPKVVQTFVKTHDYGKVLNNQRIILGGYKADMLKYAAQSDKSHISECFDSIPNQLGKDNKKFMYSTVKKGGRAKDYEGCLQWIEDAGIINRCHNLDFPELPLEGHKLDNIFKVYMVDSGLFVAMCEEGTQYDILNGNLQIYKGAVYENLIADVFGKMGRKLFYYQKDSGLEIDFFIKHMGQCLPVEIKATTGNAKSMKTLLKHTEKYSIDMGIKLGDYNIGMENGILSLPLYMAFMLKSY